MIKDFILPDIGEGIVECELVEWLVEEGDRIEEDQPVCDVMTDKALVQIPAMTAGKVVKFYHKKGDIAKVHEPLFAVEVEGEAGGEAETAAAAAEPAAAPETPSETAHAAEPEEAPAAEAEAAPPGEHEGPVPASPAVRRLARELDVDLRRVPGSGKKGRVYKDDVRAFAEGRTAAPTPSPAKAAAGDTGDIVKREPLKGVRAAMAKQMAASASTIPHYTYSDDVDVTDLLPVHQQVKANYRDELRVTLMPFFIKALSLTLRVFPQLNATFHDDANEIRYHRHHNIGVAVDGAQGLMVPNIKNVEERSILDVAKALNDVVEAARVGRVPADDMKGGTITISNIGAIGGTVATPIINKPELAIVALGSIRRLPRFDDDGNVVARDILTISWSADHRIVDGATMARFSNHWKRLLEQPALMLADLG